MFLSALATVNATVNDLRNKTTNIREKALRKGWSSRKLNRKLKKPTKKLKNWLKLQNDFQSIICSSIMFTYSTDDSKMKSNHAGETLITEFSDDNKNATKITITIREGYPAYIIHENRHGVQVINHTSGTNASYDLYDEYDAFQYQAIYSPYSIERFKKKALQIKNKGVLYSLQDDHISLQEAEFNMERN